VRMRARLLVQATRPQRIPMGLSALPPAPARGGFSAGIAPPRGFASQATFRRFAAEPARARVRPRALILRRSGIDSSRCLPPEGWSRSWRLTSHSAMLLYRTTTARSMGIAHHPRFPLGAMCIRHPYYHLASALRDRSSGFASYDAV